MFKLKIKGVEINFPEKFFYEDKGKFDIGLLPIETHVLKDFNLMALEKDPLTRTKVRSVKNLEYSWISKSNYIQHIVPKLCVKSNLSSLEVFKNGTRYIPFTTKHHYSMLNVKRDEEIAIRALHRTQGSISNAISLINKWLNDTNDSELKEKYNLAFKQLNEIK